jgi:hypothetical protein
MMHIDISDLETLMAIDKIVFNLGDLTGNISDG